MENTFVQVYSGHMYKNTFVQTSSYIRNNDSTKSHCIHCKKKRKEKQTHHVKEWTPVNVSPQKGSNLASKHEENKSTHCWHVGGHETICDHSCTNRHHCSLSTWQIFDERSWYVKSLPTHKMT